MSDSVKYVIRGGPAPVAAFEALIAYKTLLYNEGVALKLWLSCHVCSDRSEDLDLERPIALDADYKVVVAKGWGLVRWPRSQDVWLVCPVCFGIHQQLAVRLEQGHQWREQAGVVPVEHAVEQRVAEEVKS